MTNKKISILGCGIGRFGTALLAKKHHFDVFVSDKNRIKQNYKEVFISEGIPFEENQNSIEKIFPCDVLIKSPGIPADNEIILEAQKRQIPILDEIAFAANYTKAKLVGITGSNGKSTVVHMVYKILHDAGVKVEMAGNVEKSLALAIYEEHDVDVFVLELSSFQLEFFEKTHLDVACIVNISPNHLNHHKTFENYCNAKLNILQGLGPNDFFIYDGDDKNIVVETTAKKIPIFHDEVKNFPKEHLAVEGEHNIFDALLAKEICLALGISEKNILESLKAYRGLPHRIEFVREIGGISFWDDSKSTTVGATKVALDFSKNKCHEGKIIWLAGGVDKGNDYSILLKFLPYLQKIICIGKDNEKILETFGKEICLEENDMNKAVAKAFELAEEGDVVLLSPACASFDFYKNFEERGEIFQQCVKDLTL